MADQLSKHWVKATLPLGRSLPEDGVLRITHVANTGIIFGLSTWQAFLPFFSALAIFLALFLYYRYFLFNRLLVGVALGLVLGGGIGNLIDRLRFGYVTDFIDLRIYGDFSWPIFNLADSALVVGVGILIYLYLSSQRQADKS